MQRTLSDFAREARTRLGVGPQYVFPTTTGSARTASRASSRRDGRQATAVPPIFPLLPPEEGAFEAATKQNGAEAEDWPAIFSKMKQRDELMILHYDSDINNTLTMAGFISVVVTFFLIEAYRWLQPSPTDVTNQLLSQFLAQSGGTSGVQSNAQTLALASSDAIDLTSRAQNINILWGISLVLSLGTLLNGLLVKQWLREYISWTALPPDATTVLVRQLRAEGLSTWRMELIIRTLSTILQLSIMFLAAGLLELYWTLNKTVFTVLAVFIGFFGILLVVATVSPLLFASSPFKSQLAWSFAKAFLFLKYLMNTGGNLYRDWHTEKLNADLPSYSPASPDEKKGAAMKAATISWAERDRALCSLPLVGAEEFDRRRLSIRALSWVYRTFPEDDVVDSVHSRAAELIRSGDVSGFLGIIVKGLDYASIHKLRVILAEHNVGNQAFAPTHYRSMLPERRLRELDLLLDAAEVQLGDHSKYDEHQFELTVDLAEQLLFRYTPRLPHIDMRYLRVGLRWLQMVGADEAMRQPRPMQKVERACLEGFMGFTAFDMENFLGYVADKRATAGNPIHASAYEFFVLSSCALYALTSNLQTLEDPQVLRRLDLLFMLLQVHLDACVRAGIEYGGLSSSTPSASIHGQVHGHGRYPERYMMPISPLQTHHALVELERRLCWPMFIIASHRKEVVPSRLIHTLRFVLQWDRYPPPQSASAELPVIAQHNPYVWQLLQRSGVEAGGRAHPLAMMVTAYADMLAKWDQVKDIEERASGTPTDEEFLALIKQTNAMYLFEPVPEERRPFVTAASRIILCAARNLRLRSQPPNSAIQKELQIITRLMASHLDSAIHLAETSAPLADNLDRVMMSRWIHPVLVLAGWNLLLVPLELLEALGLGKACGFLSWGSRVPEAGVGAGESEVGIGIREAVDGDHAGTVAGEQEQQEREQEASPDELLGRYLTLARAAAIGQAALLQQELPSPVSQPPSPYAPRTMSAPLPHELAPRPRRSSSKSRQERGRTPQPRPLL